jgi:lysophospholipase L1-like esterase
MATLQSGQTISIQLAEGESYTVTPSGTAQVSTRGVSGSELSAPRTLTSAQTFGPYTEAGAISIACLGGTVDYTQAGGPVYQDPTTGALVGVSRVALLPTLRSEAFVKLAAGSPSFGKSTGLSASDQTVSVKVEVEAPFHAVRLVAQNRSNVEQTARTALIGVSETNATDSSNSMAHVVIGGSAYTGIAGATSQNGHRNVTWTGAANVTQAASSTAPVLALSDWIPLKSVPRADGGRRPLLMWKYWQQGSTGGNWAFGTVNAATRTATSANRGRTIVVANTFNDGVGTPARTYSLSTTVTDTFPIVRFDVPVLSVWTVGDSITGCNGLVTDTVSGWGWRACADLSTPTLPVVHSAFGVSSVTASDFWANAKAHLAAGVPPPSVLVLNPAGINEFGTTPDVRKMETIRATLVDGISVCRQYQIPYLVLMPMLPSENFPGAAEDNLRKQVNAEVAATAASFGVQVLDFSALGNGASPELWVPAYKFDAVHPNEAGIEAVMTPTLEQALRQILGA